MKQFWLGLALLVWSGLSWGEHLDLDQLLRQVKQMQGTEGRINREREARFLAEKQKQAQVLAEIEAELAQAEKASAALKQRFEANESELMGLESRLKENSGELGELFGVVRQVAADLKASLATSLVSAQFGDRSTELERIAQSKALPTIGQLEALWFTLQQEMTETGKVVRFPASIVSAGGEPRSTAAVRIGAFTVLADGLYLRYLPETGQLIELPRQPDSRYLSLAEDMASATSGLVEVAVDPTQGSILSMLVQAPSAWERIEQGGMIGYIILVLGGIGLAIVGVRLVQLSSTAGRVREQLGDVTEVDEENPLGRVLAVAKGNPEGDLEGLQLLLDEAIIREVPKLERGQAMVKLLAAVAPLLGLLGTVTGMIATFQSISLFGTGDPKLMASGISQALVTTMLGLVVAIPLLFLHSLIVTRSRGLVQILDEQSAGLIARAQEQARR